MQRPAAAILNRSIRLSSPFILSDIFFALKFIVTAAAAAIKAMAYFKTFIILHFLKMYIKPHFPLCKKLFQIFLIFVYFKLGYKIKIIVSSHNE